MPVRDSYAHGIPSWIDLDTPDLDGAKRFYGGLFGWTFDDVPAGDMTYTMATRDGKAIAGLAPQSPERAEQGVPPMWNHYVNVDDVDATTARVVGLGGSVLVEPFDVMDAGRMAVIADPTGAVTCLWQKNQSIGAELVNEPGTFSWSEVYTPDVDKAVAFYSELLGWKRLDMDMGPMGTYVVLTTDGTEATGFAGALPPPMEGIPPYWAVWFAVDDTDATVAKAQELGGSVLQEPFDIPPGRCAVVADPAGASFFVIRFAQPTE